MMKKEYEVLKKKFNLPDYDSVNNELEISDIDEEDFLIRRIMDKVKDRIDTITDTMGTILQPSADSLVDMHECRFFTDKDKKVMVEIYKKLMIIRRTTSEADIEKDDKIYAQVILDFFKEWPGLKKEIIPMLAKRKLCWKEETEIEENLGYFV